MWAPVHPKKLFTAPLPAIIPAFQEVGFTLVDVGGRDDPVQELVSLAPFAHYVVSEPDRDAVIARGPWRKLTVVREAIAAGAGEATLYLASSRGMSSLREPDPAVVGQLPIAARFAIEGTCRVGTTTLDAAAAAGGFTDACFLKLDTQGTELEILRSGAGLLPSVLGVKVEVSFRPYYRGQALFSDVDTYLRRAGFELFALERAHFRRAGRRPQLYSRRGLAWAHCLYLREPAGLPREALIRLLGLALAWQQVDLALEIAGALPELFADVETAAERLTRHRLYGQTPADSIAELADSSRDKSAANSRTAGRRDR